MSTETLRKLCDAMDALEVAADVVTSGMVLDQINASRNQIALSMQDLAFEFGGYFPSAVSTDDWRAGYNAALEDADCGDVKTSAHYDIGDAVHDLFEEEQIDWFTHNLLMDAYAGAEPGDENKDVIDAAIGLVDDDYITLATLGIIINAAQV